MPTTTITTTTATTSEIEEEIIYPSPSLCTKDGNRNTPSEGENMVIVVLVDVKEEEESYPPRDETISSTTIYNNPELATSDIATMPSSSSSNPKLNRAFSRKNSMRGERKQTPLQEGNPTNNGSKYDPKGMTGGRRFNFWQRLSTSSNFKPSILPINGTTSTIPHDSFVSPRALGVGTPKVVHIKENLLSYGNVLKHFASLDPQNVLLIFASISCLGSTFLIYLTITLLREEQSFLA